MTPPKTLTVHHAAVFVRLLLTVFVLIKVYEHSHWSVAFALTMLAINAEVTVLLIAQKAKKP